ncbi:DUF2490 domain-containing protein [Cryomorphaceae bacterium]|nr:DUF2490 domain-containing protein [Cryomorphaceae bacterium]
MKKITAIALIMTLALGVRSQDVNPSVWGLYNGRYDLNDQWFLNTEVHLRFTDGVSTFQQFLFRPQVSYVLSSHFIFSAGYTYIHSYPYGAQPIATDFAENNLWEEVMINHTWNRLKFSHRLRMEHRWQQRIVLDEMGGVGKDGYTYGNRFRYRLTLEHPIGSGPWSVVVYDEVFFGTNQFLVPQGVNQNWLYISAKYKVSDRLAVQTGWQQQYLELAGGGTQQNPTWLTAVHLRIPAR